MRLLMTAHGAITRLVLAETPYVVDLEGEAQSVSLTEDGHALVLLDAEPGAKNLLVLNPRGEELARLGTTCGTGTLQQVLVMQDELRVIEMASRGDFQAVLDLEKLTLTRVAEWR